MSFGAEKYVRPVRTEELDRCVERVAAGWFGLGARLERDVVRE